MDALAVRVLLVFAQEFRRNNRIPQFTAGFFTVFDLTFITSFPQAVNIVYKGHGQNA